MTITSLEPLVLPMPEPEDEVDVDPYPEYGSRDEFERAQWFGDRAKRPEPRLSKTSTPSATTAKSLSKETQ